MDWFGRFILVHVHFRSTHGNGREPGPEQVVLAQERELVTGREREYYSEDLEVLCA